jgi:hypothetical protein
MSARLLVLAVVVSLVAACGTASSPSTFGPTPAATPGPTSTLSETATPATSTIVAGTIALPALTAAQAAAAASCLRDTGYWVLRGSAIGRWLTWAEGIAGPELQLVWPAGYRARFTPLLEVLAPDGPAADGAEAGDRLAGRREERVAQIDGPVKVEDVVAVQAIGPPRQPPMRSSVQDQR